MLYFLLLKKRKISALDRKHDKNVMELLTSFFTAAAAASERKERKILLLFFLLPFLKCRHEKKKMGKKRWKEHFSSISFLKTVIGDLCKYMRLKNEE